MSYPITSRFLSSYLLEFLNSRYKKIVLYPYDQFYFLVYMEQRGCLIQFRDLFINIRMKERMINCFTLEQDPLAWEMSAKKQQSPAHENGRQSPASVTLLKAA